MTRRRTVLVAVIVALVVAALAATSYLTGLIIVGDPFSGTWRIDPNDATTGVVVKRASAGYEYAVVMGKTSTGWFAIKRHGRTLTSRMRVLDNAMAESVIATIKRELISRYRWPTRLDLELALVSYVGWYNARRRHRSLKARRAGRTATQAPLQVLEQYNHHTPASLVPK